MTHSPDDVSSSLDSRLLEELGENLVTRNHVAVGELVKHAYHADATAVCLEFVELPTNTVEKKQVTKESGGLPSVAWLTSFG